jgi:adenylate cyclase
MLSGHCGYLQDRRGAEQPVRHFAFWVNLPLAMAATRRLAAILAADVAGYSRLMGADEEGTLERLKALRRELVDPTIAEHHGRIVKTTGDGLLVEFASVVDAMRCATAWQAAMADRNTVEPGDSRIEFRIGVNLGDIIIDGDDIHGDGVNIAARLEAMAEPCGICVSRTVITQTRGKLEFPVEDIGEQALKNIAQPVHVLRVLAKEKPIPAPVRPPLALPDKPSIAVLPFANMSNDPDQEFFADGIAEDIITVLSRYPSLFVIARNSTFTYKGRAVDVKQIGHELGVRYVLEGSLRKSGNRIRVTAQLVEAETGNHVWAEHYDRDLADIFAVQDEIAAAVTIAIAPAIAQAEQQRAMRKPPGSLDAWSAYQRGLWHLSKGSAGDNVLAQKFFQQAIDLDPLFAGGYTGLAAALNRAWGVFQTRSYTEGQSAEEAAARRAVALDGADAEARSRLSLALLWGGDHYGARAESERALAISPNLASAHGALGVALTYSGQPKEGLTALETCIRLDPRAWSLVNRLGQVAMALYFCREYAAAVEAGKHVIRSFPDRSSHYRWLAAALGQLSPSEEAKEALERAIAVTPASFDVVVRRRWPWMRPEDHAHYLDGLRKAGWTG